MPPNEERKPGDLGQDNIASDRARQLNTLIGLSEKFGVSLSNAFAKNISEGKKFDDVLKSVRQSLVEQDCAWRSRLFRWPSARASRG